MLLSGYVHLFTISHRPHPSRRHPPPPRFLPLSDLYDNLASPCMVFFIIITIFFFVCFLSLCIPISRPTTVHSRKMIFYLSCMVCLVLLCSCALVLCALCSVALPLLPRLFFLSLLLSIWVEWEFISMTAYEMQPRTSAVPFKTLACYLRM